MDIALNYLDRHLFDAFYASLAPHTASLRDAALSVADSSFKSSHVVAQAWPRDSIVRQCITLCISVYVATHLMYFALSGGSYLFLYDHRLKQHPRFLKNQVRQEIKMSLQGFPWLTIMMLPFFLGEVRGHSQLYGDVQGPFSSRTVGYVYMALSTAFFLLFTDFCIYWIHRWEHHPRVYKWLHKPHHKWVIPTPMASHAFHPLDGMAQALPYHIFVYLFPLNKVIFVGLFVFVNLWTIGIHDAEISVGSKMEKFINTSSHHTVHHMQFVYNYGQFFTWADRMGNSHKDPVESDDPLLTVLAAQAVKKQEQTLAAELARKAEVEGRSPNSECSDESGNSSDSGIAMMDKKRQ